MMRINRTNELRWELIEVTSKYGFLLAKLIWMPDSDVKKISWNSIGIGLELYVYGLPLDFPTWRLKELVDRSLQNSDMELMIDSHKPRFKWPISLNKKKEEEA